MTECFLWSKVQIRKIKNLKFLNQNMIQDSTLRLSDSPKRINQKTFGFNLYLASLYYLILIPPHVGVFETFTTAYMEEN